MAVAAVTIDEGDLWHQALRGHAVAASGRGRIGNVGGHDSRRRLGTLGKRMVLPDGPRSCHDKQETQKDRAEGDKLPSPVGVTPFQFEPVAERFVEPHVVTMLSAWVKHNSSKGNASSVQTLRDHMQTTRCWQIMCRKADLQAANGQS